MSGDYSAQLKKAFQELQTKVTDTNRRLQQGETAKKQQEQKQRVAELTKVQLSEMDKSLPVYRGVGRIFVRESVDSEISRQEEVIEKAKEKIKAILRHNEYLEKDLADAEQNIRELVQSRP